LDTKVNPKPPWRMQKEAYLAHLQVDTGVLRVSRAD
jgi:hypothetical protein